MRSVRLVAILLSILIVCGCRTTETTEEFASKTNFYRDITVMIDADGFKRRAAEKRVYLADADLPGKKLTFDQAMAHKEIIGKESLVYNLDSSIDKTNPKSPFYKNVPNFFYLNKSNYVGNDDWSRESGAERNTSIEYWLAEEMLHMVSQDKTLIDWRPDLVGGKKVEGINDIQFTFTNTRADMIKMIEFVIAKGFDVDSAENLAIHCYGEGFFRFKYSTSMTKEEKKKISDIQDGWLGKNNLGQVQRSPGGCDFQKENLQVDGISIFQGYKRLNPKTIRNKVNKTVYIENPEFSVGLWQHLMSDGLYQTNQRITKQGVFSGLVTPERSKISFAYKDARTTRNVALINDPYAYSHTLEASVSHIAYQWFGDDQFIHTFNNQTHSRRWGELKSEVAHMGGKVSGGLMSCDMDRSLVNVHVSGGKVNRYYKCSMGAGKSGLTKGTAHFSSYIPYKATSNARPLARFTGHLTLDSKVVAHENIAKTNCDDAIYKPSCAASQPVTLSWFIKTRILQRVSPNTVLAYTRLNENDKVEGVVHYFGTEFIYNLDDIASWYAGKNKAN